MWSNKLQCPICFYVLFCFVFVFKLTKGQSRMVGELDLGHIGCLFENPGLMVKKWALYIKGCKDRNNYIYLFIVVVVNITEGVSQFAPLANVTLTCSHDYTENKYGCLKTLSECQYCLTLQCTQNDYTES